MNRLSIIKFNQTKELESFCNSNNVDLKSVELLLEAERTKKLLKRNALIQSNIDKEINNAIENENRKNSNQ